MCVALICAGQRGVIWPAGAQRTAASQLVAAAGCLHMIWPQEAADNGREKNEETYEKESDKHGQ